MPDLALRSQIGRFLTDCPATALQRWLKAEVLEDLVARIDPAIAVTPIYGDITYTDEALRARRSRLRLPRDRHNVRRYAFNAITHQYFIPSIQVGSSKVSADDTTGAIDLIHVNGTSRDARRLRVGPGAGSPLHCNGSRWPRRVGGRAVTSLAPEGGRLPPG